MADTIKTIEAKLTTVKTSLSNIKTSIVNKGQIPTGDITTYATAIDNISTSSGLNFDWSKNYTTKTQTNNDVSVQAGETGELTPYQQYTNVLLFKDAKAPQLLTCGIVYGDNEVSVFCEQLIELKEEGIFAVVQLSNSATPSNSNDFITAISTEGIVGFDPAEGEAIVDISVGLGQNTIDLSSEVYSRCIIFAIS